MKKYTYDEVMAASLEYFNGDELAASVFTSKYALQDLDGNLYELTPSDMHRRLAREFARIESKYPNPMSEDEIYDLLSDWSVVPQGSPMSAVGNPFKVQSLSNCFVVDSPHDSYGGILFTDQEQAQIMKRRGGVGFDISTIRPRGMPAANAASTTDGIGVFMQRFSNTCREVAQGGRRGALMITISVLHPEIETFINIKRDLKKVTGANISIRLTDDFMQAVKDDTDFVLRWPVDAAVDTAKVTKVVRARTVWDQIIDAAWSSAEPGILFWDNVKKNTPTEAYSDLGYGNVSTNPCGELVLSPYDSCRLLLINLYKFVKNPFGNEAFFDYTTFYNVAYQAQRLMDNLVDLELEAIDTIIAKVESDPEPSAVKATEINLWKKIKNATAGGRRTGLGVTGLGDALAAIGVKYGSHESIGDTEKIYKTMALAAYNSSIDMAEERGAFPVYDGWAREMKNPFLEKIFGSLRTDEAAKWKMYGRRNISLTTTSPAGSVSTLTQTTSGIEPAFLLSYKRRKKITAADITARVDFVDAMGDRWQEYKVYHHGFKAWMNVTGKTDDCVAESPYAGATSNEIDWEMSVKMQAAAQRWVCHSLSKTCNLPNNVSRDTVAKVYMTAWESGCKGFTVYRDGCRDGVLINDSSSPPATATEDQPIKMIDSHAPKRPKELRCDIHRITAKGDEYMVLVGLLDGRPYEVFCGLSSHVEVPKKVKGGVLVKNGKKDGVATYNLQIPLGDDDFITFKDVVNLFDNPTWGAFTRTISLSLRHGIPVQYLVEQIQKDKNSDMFSFSKAISRVLKGYIPDGTKSADIKACLSCGAGPEVLAYQEGCVTCKNCGSSKCS